MLFDTHTHIAQYDRSEIKAIVERARDAGVSFIAAAGTTVEDSECGIKLAQDFPEILPCVGLHPENLRLDKLEADLEKIENLAENKNVYAISEIGLDFEKSEIPREIQKQAFKMQIEIAVKVKKPVIFHSRAAISEVYEILQNYNVKDFGAVWHYFTGDLVMANRFVELGCKISFSTLLTNLAALKDCLKQLDMKDIVIETDSFPQSYKRKRENWLEPYRLLEVAKYGAKLKGIPLKEFAKVTTENAKSIFKI